MGVTTGLTSNNSAFSISTVLISSHPLESVIVTVYVSAFRPVLALPLPLSLHVYEYGATPPVGVTVMVPLLEL